MGTAVTVVVLVQTVVTRTAMFSNNRKLGPWFLDLYNEYK